MSNYCSQLPDHKVSSCEAGESIASFKAFVKNGMARKAFLKYLETSDLKNIQRQIDKGIVTVIK